MKMREVAAIVLAVLVGSLIYFWPKGDDDGGPDEVAAKSDPGAELTSRGGGSADSDDGGSRREVSRRVLKDKPQKITTESGLQYEVLVEGEGEHPGPTSTVKVHYVGTLEDGTVFDSSRERDMPAEFPLNGVIKGWTEGLQLMKPGGMTRFTIPSDLAYGDRGAGESIPGGATLVFEVELLSIVKP